MRVNCKNGVYKFIPKYPYEIELFEAKYGELVKETDYWTFAKIGALPFYAFKGNEYAGQVAIKSYAGLRESIFNDNAIVYNFEKDLFEKLESQSGVLEISSGTYYSSRGLPQYGSIVKWTESRLVSFSGWLNLSLDLFKYEAVNYASI